MAHSSVVRHVAASLQLAVASIGSFVPSNAVRVGVLRLVGARVGQGVAIHHGLGIRSPHKVRIGNDSWIDEGVRLDGRGGLSIGDHVSIGARVQIWTAAHDWASETFEYTSDGVVVHDRAWLAAACIVLPGVVVGEGAVVAAGAVVASDVPPWTVVAGVPARRIADRPAGMRYRLDARRNKLWWW